MPSNNSEGSQAATVTTEHTLATVTTAGNYIFKVDTNAMALDDILELRVKSKVRSTGTTRTEFSGVYAHVQEEPIKTAILDSTVNEVVITLKQTAGTGRTYDWALVDVS